MAKILENVRFALSLLRAADGWCVDESAPVSESWMRLRARDGRAAAVVGEHVDIGARVQGFSCFGKLAVTVTRSVLTWSELFSRQTNALELARRIKALHLIMVALNALRNTTRMGISAFCIDDVLFDSEARPEFVRPRLAVNVRATSSIQLVIAEFLDKCLLPAEILAVIQATADPTGTTRSLVSACTLHYDGDVPRMIRDIANGVFAKPASIMAGLPPCEQLLLAEGGFLHERVNQCATELLLPSKSIAALENYTHVKTLSIRAKRGACLAKRRNDAVQVVVKFCLLEELQAALALHGQPWAAEILDYGLGADEKCWYVMPNYATIGEWRDKMVEQKVAPADIAAGIGKVIDALKQAFVLGFGYRELRAKHVRVSTSTSTALSPRFVNYDELVHVDKHNINPNMSVTCFKMEFCM